ncbi:HDOD domain-containing protein [Stutzerimonas kirkiae]|uniref:HDOD domain-containing protein n=1 Tax=Stutzerimonas kirkiae TaxID=2211392 RepID=UPI0010385B7D|nr:HDOD domain-containing protein [Stutzerimonas kirkiae]TBV03577.1 histidine kinase [Stutzerimonas kirkiae]TBV09830.1 histidine kinase [Stutzerimonas kirkiae]
MTTQSQRPRTISAWIEVLDAVRMPAFAINHERAHQALRQSNSSIREIADRIQASPVLALSVMREANRTSGERVAPAESLEIALSRIGLKRTEELLLNIPSVQPADIPLPLRQIIVISQHASQQANGLFASRLARLWQEIHWGSLLLLSPMWPMVAAYPDIFQAWEERVLANGENAATVEMELLGVPLFRLCLAMAEHWNLPEWIIQSHRLLSSDRQMLVKALHIAKENEHPLEQQQHLDNDPELRRWLTHPGNTALMANGLAFAAHHSWGSPHTLRWQRLIALYLQVPLPELQQRVHQQAVINARNHPLPGPWQPAVGLLWPWNSRFQLPRKAQAQKAPPGDIESWRKHCAELLQSQTPYANRHQLAHAASQALLAGGLQRVLIMQPDALENRLTTLVASGFPVETSKFTLNGNQSPILRKLLEKPLKLRIDAKNSAQYSALLPGKLKALFNSDHLFMRSLGSNVSLLIITDQNGLPFSDARLQLCEKTLQCIDRAVANFSR